jgi:hypothetical protein
VTGVLNDDQFRVGPGASELPCGDERPGHVEPAMDQDAKLA